MLNMIVMIASTIQTIRVLAPIAIALYFPGHPLLNLSEKPSVQPAVALRRSARLRTDHIWKTA
jgi:hypothetical protein